MSVVAVGRLCNDKMMTVACTPTRDSCSRIYSIKVACKRTLHVRPNAVQYNVILTHSS